MTRAEWNRNKKNGIKDPKRQHAAYIKGEIHADDENSLSLERVFQREAFCKEKL